MDEAAAYEAVKVAAQLGRFDLASLLLAAVAILLAVAAIPAYLFVHTKLRRSQEKK